MEGYCQLKRVFKLDIENCGGQIKGIASIEDPLVIGRILAPLNRPASSDTTVLRPPVRGPPLPGVLNLS